MKQNIRKNLCSENLEYVESGQIRASIIGPQKCINIVAYPKGDKISTMIALAAPLIEMADNRILLSHIIVEDEMRRFGICTEFVRFYEDRLGQLDACWVSKTGIAFAKKYVERFGPRPHWQIGENPAHKDFLDALMARSRK